MPPAATRTLAQTGIALAALLAGATCIALSLIWVRLSETGLTAAAFWRVALASPALWLLRPCARGSVLPPIRHRKLLLAPGIAFAGRIVVLVGIYLSRRGSS
ncbi:MAG: hypothetical protein ACREU5_10390 [Burkholderiales bacterium]